MREGEREREREKEGVCERGVYCLYTMYMYMHTYSMNQFEKLD